MAGPFRLRNLNVSILEDKDTYIRPGHACSGEIILGNPFLVASGLNVKDFLATNLERLASIDYGSLETTSNPTTVGRLGMKLLRNEIDSGEDVIDPFRIGSMMSNGSFPLKDGDDIYYKDVDIGEQKDTELQEAIEDMINRASRNCEKVLRNSLKELVHEFKDIFRTLLGKDPPVDVEPMRIKFEDNPRPIKVRQRSYSPEQLTFLKKKVNELVDAGYIVRNSTSK